MEGRHVDETTRIARLSLALTSRLIEAGGDARGRSVGDEDDDALAETTVGLYKPEKTYREGPWYTLAELEPATREWDGW